MAGPQELFVPKTANRFVMTVANIPSFLVKKVTRPSITFGDVTLDHINVKRKLKGKADWGNITCDLYDPVVPSAAQAVMEWVRLSHESVTGRDGYADFYKKDITFNVLGPVGDKVEEWTLKGAYVQSTAKGSLDWATDSALMLSITVAYDYAILQF